MLLSKLQMRDRLLEVAREWVGTPYQHQAMLKGVGTDCVGLVIGAAMEAGVFALSKAQVKEYAGYGRLPNPVKMEKYLRKHLLPIADMEVLPGDVAWIEWRSGLPMHLALVGEKTLIHAASDIGKAVEHRLSALWRDRIVSFWRFPDLD